MSRKMARVAAKSGRFETLIGLNNFLILHCCDYLNLSNVNHDLLLINTYRKKGQLIMSHIF